MIGRARTNIRALIEDQCEILSQMISGIADRYNAEAYSFEEEIKRNAKVNSEGDYDIYSSIVDTYSDSVDMHYTLCFEARKILFCAIFSYLESMLYGIISYYEIERCNTNQISQLIDKIANQYKKWFNEELILPNDLSQKICEYYRPLRNYYMHGELDSDKDKANLETFIDSNSNYIVSYYEIKDNEFLRCVLSEMNSFLLNIEEAYVFRMTEKKWMI